MFVSKSHWSRIKEKKALLVAIRPLPKEALEKFRTQMKLELTYHSNAIEGNTLTLNETRLVILEGITVGGKSTREHLEAINHATAFDKLAELEKVGRLSLVEILELNEIVMRGISQQAGQL